MSTCAGSRARQILKAAKLYSTEARVAILCVLMQASEPLRQDQIAEEPACKAINKVTIYRTLESLMKAGLVHRAFLQDRSWHFELADHCTEAQCHPHFTCRSCGKTHCLPDMSLPMVQSPYNGFVITHQQVWKDFVRHVREYL